MEIVGAVHVLTIVDENFEHQDVTTEAPIRAAHVVTIARVVTQVDQDVTTEVAILVGRVVMIMSDIQAVQDVTTEAVIRAPQGVPVVENVTHDVELILTVHELTARAGIDQILA